MRWFERVQRDSEFISGRTLRLELAGREKRKCQKSEKSHEVTRERSGCQGEGLMEADDWLWPIG